MTNGGNGRRTWRRWLRGGGGGWWLLVVGKIGGCGWLRCSVERRIVECWLCEVVCGCCILVWYWWR